MFARTLAVAAVAALSVAGAAQAKPKKPPHILPDLSKVPKLAAIPPEQVAAFPVLAQPVAKGIPDLVLRTFQDARTARTYGTDPRQARAITGQRGGTWYIVPGTKGMCLYVSAGGVCMSTEQAVTGHLSYMRVPPPPPDWMPGRPLPDSIITLVGVAPTGSTSISASLTSGATTSLPIGPTGAYRLQFVGQFQKVVLTRDGAPVTLSELPPPAPAPQPPR